MVKDLCEYGRCSRAPRFEGNTKRPCAVKLRIGGREWEVCHTCSILLQREHRALEPPHSEPTGLLSGVGRTIEDPDEMDRAEAARQREMLREFEDEALS